VTESKLGWGLVGASNIARAWMIAAINTQPNSQVVAVMSSDSVRAQNFAYEFGIPAAYNSLDAILADPRVNIIYISTMNNLHHAQTIAATQAGKHVLCEKPLALTLADASDSIQSCKRAGVVLGTNHHLRNSIVHRTMRQMIQDGAIGTPLAARLYRAQYLSQQLQGWRINQADGGGAILDMTVHDADTARFVLNSEVDSVVAIKTQQGLAVGDLEDTVMGIMQFRNGVMTQFHDSYVVKHATMGFEIFGTEGSLFANNAMSQNPVGQLYVRRNNERQEIPLAHRDLYERSVRLFNAAVRGQGEPAATGEDGFRSLQIALAVRESAITGKRVYLND
jgi:1,5-anhydro-D-fructose reductase (1,5-anhydro-D-mannitol-forming)